MKKIIRFLSAVLFVATMFQVICLVSSKAEVNAQGINEKVLVCGFHDSEIDKLSDKRVLVSKTAGLYTLEMWHGSDDKWTVTYHSYDNQLFKRNAVHNQALKC